MASTITRANMRTAARRRADMVSSTFVTDAEFDDFLNIGIKKLHALVFRANPDHHLVTSAHEITTTAGATAYSLPSDFMALRRVDYVSSGARIPIDPAPIQEIVRDTSGPYSYATQYRLVGSGEDGSDVRLWLLPDPGNGTYEVLYVRAPHQLDNDADAFDGMAGFENYVILDAAIQAIDKEESDSSALRAERQEWKEIIESVARRRDASRPPRVADVRTKRYRHERHPAP